MKTIIDYRVISEHDLDKMTQGVQHLIETLGWQPLGSFQVSVPVLEGAPAPLYCQAMVKYQKSVG